jgi:S1-C subfamily serine protease
VSVFQRGDVLIRIGSMAIHSPPDVLNASFFLTADEDVPITVLRDGREVSVTVTAAEHPTYLQQKLPLFAPANRENSHRFRASD